MVIRQGFAGKARGAEDIRLADDRTKRRETGLSSTKLNFITL